MWVTWGHTAATGTSSLVRGDTCTSNCALTMDINLNLYTMNLSTANGSKYPTSVYTTCSGTPSVCTLTAGAVTPSILGFYLTFYNSNTATSTLLFADAFLGLLEFTPVPNTGAATKDNILVALNQKSSPTAVPPQVAPSLALTNYGNDWSASAFNTL